jgi:hypothetical protein
LKKLKLIFSHLALFTLFLLFVTHAARADEPKEAVDRFERGVALYRGGSPEAAIIEFEAAHKLTNNYRLLYNIALCRADAKDYVGATETYRRYLQDGGDQIEKSRRDEVNEQIKRLALFVGKLTVRTNIAAGSEVFVDDRLVGMVPLPGPLTLNVGSRKVSILWRGAVLASRTVVVSSSDENVVDLNNTSSGTGTNNNNNNNSPVDAKTPSGDETPKSKTDGGERSFPWLPWAIGGALGIGGAVTGILAIDARNEAAQKAAVFGARTEDIEPHQSKAETLGLATDLLLGGAVLAAGVATIFTIRYLSSRPSTSARANAAVSKSLFVVGGTF